MTVERLEFVIQCETSVELFRSRYLEMDEFQQGVVGGLRRVHEWARSGEHIRDRVESWVPSEEMIRNRRQFLAGFRAGLERGSDIVQGRV